MRAKRERAMALAGLALLCGAPFVGGGLAEVVPGDIRGDVLGKAGEPSGTLQAGSVTILVYPAGRVLMEADRVTEVELRPANELETEEMRLERLAKGEAERQRRDQSRIERGKLIMEQKLSDPTFLSLPVETRLSYWMQFNRLYPELEVIPLIQAARNELKEEEKWDQFQSQMRYADRRTSYSQGIRRVPVYSSYGGRHHYHRPVHLPADEGTRDSGIILFEDATLFSPSLPTLPGGEIR